MRVPVCVALAAIVLLASLAAVAEPPDPALLSRINQGRSDQDQVTARDVQVLHPQQFPGVTLVGYRMDQSNYMLGSVLVDGRLLDPTTASGVVLDRLGWRKASASERRRLARMWLADAVLAFGDTMLDNDTGDFSQGHPSTPRFEPPQVETSPDGSLRLITWIQEAPGMRLGTFYRQTVFLFGSDGRLVRSKVLNRFYVPPH